MLYNILFDPADTMNTTWQEKIMAPQNGAMVSIQYCLISLYGGDDKILMDIMK
jgi:hypothetical protein